MILGVDFSAGGDESSRRHHGTLLRGEVERCHPLVIAEVDLRPGGNRLVGATRVVLQSRVVQVAAAEHVGVAHSSPVARARAVVHKPSNQGDYASETQPLGLLERPEVESADVRIPSPAFDCLVCRRVRSTA